jgi:hypothetical protein
MSQNLNNSSVIEDIDLPLYEYGLIHKQNTNNYLITNKQKKFQATKSYASTAFMLLIIIRLLIQLRFYKNPNYPIFNFDFLFYFGGLTQFAYAIGLFGAVMTLRLIYLFNYSDESLYEWLDIIKVLKGLKNMDSIGFKNKKEYESFVQRIKFFRFLIEITLKYSAILFFFSFIGITFLVSKTIQSLFFGILSAIFHVLWANYTLGVQLYSFLFYFMSCYYFEIRFKILNNNISRNSKLSVLKLTTRIIREHNNICNDILKYNKFWKSFYFTLTYTIIPINLMLLQQLLLDDIVFTAFLIYSLVVIIYLFSHIILNLISASVNKNASKSHKFLYKFQTQFPSLINVRQKIKVLIIKELNKDLNKLFNCVYYSY